MSVAVVIPCYDEEKRLDRDAFLRALDEFGDLRFHLVDDGSRDATFEMLEDLARRAPDGRVIVKRLAVNSGKAEAVRLGVLAELDAGARAVGYWDADLATPLDAISTFATILDERPSVDVVLGSRVRLLGHQIDRRLHRHLRGRVFATTVSLMLGLPVYDTQCGAKLLRAGDAVRQAFSEPFISRWIFDVEMLARLVEYFHTQGVAAESRIVEKPLNTWVDVAGSKIGISDVARAVAELAQIERRYGRSVRRHNQ